MMTDTHLQATLENDMSREFHYFAPGVSELFKALGDGQVLPQTVKFYDKFDMRMQERSSQISCRPGCNYCCHYHVMATATEIFAIAEVISNMPGHVREDLKIKIKNTAERVSAMSVDDYIHTNIPCALLKDGLCSVYSVRPIACRGHHSADVNVCKEANDNPSTDALTPKNYDMEVTFRAFENLQAMVSYQKGLDTSKYELHAALNEALGNPASFKRWKNKKLAFPNVRDRADLESN